MTERIQGAGASQAQNLNSYADEILNYFADSSVRADQEIKTFTESWAGIAAEGAVKGADVREGMWQLSLNKHVEDLGLPMEYLEKYSPSKLRPGALSKTLSFAGSALDAYTGVVSVGKALKQDLDSGDKSLKGTMVEISKSVGKSGLTFATTSVVMGATAAALGGAVLLPAVVGVGAGMVAGYAFDKVVDGLSSVDFQGAFQSVTDKLKFW